MQCLECLNALYRFKILKKFVDKYHKSNSIQCILFYYCFCYCHYCTLLYCPYSWSDVVVYSQRCFSLYVKWRTELIERFSLFFYRIIMIKKHILLTRLKPDAKKPSQRWRSQVAGKYKKGNIIILSYWNIWRKKNINFHHFRLHRIKIHL